jgi:hypothetical protein
MVCEKCLRKEDCLPLLFSKKYPELRPMVEQLTKCEMLTVVPITEPQEQIKQGKTIKRFVLASILVKNLRLFFSHLKMQRKALYILLLITGAVTYLF